MNLKLKILSFFVILIALLVANVFYNEKIESFEAEFSKNLKSWFNKGKSFHYRGFEIFFVHEVLNSNDVENENDDKIENQKQENITIVFLHGFPTSSYDYFRVWNLFLNDHLNEDGEKLNKSYVSLLAFDHLGYGFSQKPNNYKYCLFDKSNMVQELLKSLGIKEIILIAHDMSDSVALELVRRQNLKIHNYFNIKKCILMNGGIIMSTLRPILSQKILRINYINHLYAKSINWPLFKYIGDFSTVFGSLNKPNETELYDFYLTIKFNDGFNILPLTIEYMSQREKLSEIWYDALNVTEIPVIFIYGPADPINPHDLFPQKLLSDIKGIELKVLSDFVGHYPQFEDPFNVFQLIKKFLIS